LLSALQNDESEYVRLSVGNALRDISKNFPALVKNELANWDITINNIKQTHTSESIFATHIGLTPD
jgi:3-methyladenine DNA glycosylase AlkC